jgi:hypothetical protein
MILPLALRFLHVLAAALWMGSGLFWPGALRRALALGPPHPAPALEQARAGLGLDLGSGVATMVTGLAYASPLGNVPMRTGILVGFVLALGRLALLFALARPALLRASEALARGDLEAARAASKRLPAYSGSAHLLWLLALMAMLFPL